MRSVFAQKAEEVVYGDREETYDDPNQNFRKIAQVWSGILGIQIKPSQVGLMMVGLKLVRENHKHQDDNLIDAHGYLMCTERILAQALGQETSQKAHEVHVGMLGQSVAEQKADLEAKLTQLEKIKDSRDNLVESWASHDRQPSHGVEGSVPIITRRKPPIEPRDALDMG